MIRQFSDRLETATRGRGFHELTDEISAFVRKAGMKEGLLTVFLEHTSASLLIQENADPDVRVDLERFFARLVQDGDKLFIHTAEGRDDMPAHIRAALTTVTLTVPVRAGKLALGTWQGIYLWEHRLQPHRRKIALHLIGD